VSWATVEHAYQAAKTHDEDVKEMIRLASTPGKAKKLGNDRKITIMRTDWDDIKDDVMLDLLRIKFKDTWMREHLMETDDATLIEGNTWHDQYWGDCYCLKHAMKPGLNRLGVLLMQVRDEVLVEEIFRDL
jgi:ribA/ribD-fused uncharacterized protein